MEYDDETPDISTRLTETRFQYRILRETAYSDLESFRAAERASLAWVDCRIHYDEYHRSRYDDEPDTPESA